MLYAGKDCARLSDGGIRNEITELNRRAAELDDLEIAYRAQLFVEAQKRGLPLREFDDFATGAPPVTKNEAILTAIEAALEPPAGEWDEHELEQYRIGVLCTELAACGYEITPIMAPGTRQSTRHDRSGST